MAAPFIGKTFEFSQPDGTKISLRGWGNQYVAVFETLDGYTVVQHPGTQFFEYAILDKMTGELKPSGRAVSAESKPPEGIAPGLRADVRVTRAEKMARRATQPKSRWEERREKARAEAARIRLQGGLATFERKPVVRSGNIVGLTIPVNFKNRTSTVSRAEIEAFCNKPGYDTGAADADNGDTNKDDAYKPVAAKNNGSVRDYFFDVSGGKLTYTNVVSEFYTAKNNVEYYNDPDVDYTVRAIELVEEALNHLKMNKFDFSPITADEHGLIYAVNLFYAGDVPDGHRKGLWPHQHSLFGKKVEVAKKKYAFDYQITNIGSKPVLATFCHENGHMLCDFPDLYDNDKDPKGKPVFRGVGHYCTMCWMESDTNPTQIGAYLKIKAGWADKIVEIKPGDKVSLTAGKNEFAIFRRNNDEYFVIESRLRKHRDTELASEGLAIWHIDEAMDENRNEFEEMNPVRHYECSIEQFDEKFDLEKGNGVGDSGDLFPPGPGLRFGPKTKPSSNWWDDTPSGLSIKNITRKGDVFTFECAADMA